MTPNCQFHADAQTMAVAAAALIERRIREVLRRREDCVLAVAGGTTPLPTYRRLIESDIDWACVHLIQTDERMTPDPAQRYGTALASAFDLTDTADAARPRWHPIPHGNPFEVAGLYAEQIARLPRPDIVVLGLGADGHTAAIFEPDIPVCTQTVLATTRDDEDRVTLSQDHLHAIPTRILLATGSGKKAAVTQLLTPADSAARTSAALVLDENGYLFADFAAQPAALA
ncbi:6-phosphogluconolactonase [Nocardia sp. NPDC006630]|uniref:6-phosphogluconolactonase n=1 Tax=Nocardia sp. NPDC006630 TaxID=3157181 RepID=UPI0033A96CD3